MIIKITEAEAHFLILKALGLDDARTSFSMHPSGVALLRSPHSIEITKDVTVNTITASNIPDECFRTEDVDV